VLPRGSCVDAGIDPDTGRRRYRTATVRGNRADAERGLANLIAEVRANRAVGATSTLSELLEAWFAIASVSWAPTTVRQTRSVLDRYLHPHLGVQPSARSLRPMIDVTYAILRERGSTHGGPLSPGTLARVHVVLRSDTMRVAFCAGWIEGPDGPTLAPTKTKRRHSVDLDTMTFATLVGLADDCAEGFVFRDDGGVTAWKPNRVTKAFVRHRRAAGLGESVSTICGTSRPPRSSTPPSHSPSWPADSTTSTLRRRSTATPKAYPAQMAKPR
jgi:hypothetical protein